MDNRGNIPTNQSNSMAIIISVIAGIALIAVLSIVFINGDTKNEDDNSVDNSVSEGDNSSNTNEQQSSSDSTDSTINEQQSQNAPESTIEIDPNNTSNTQNPATNPEPVSTEAPIETSVLPADWDSLTGNEKIARNPYNCDPDIEVIRADNGQCLELVDNDDNQTPIILETDTLPNISRLHWNVANRATFSLTAYNGQVIESVGYGFPNNRTKNCDSDTAYDFSQTNFLGIGGGGSASVKDSPSDPLVITGTYTVHEYSISVAADYVSGICFMIRYRAASGQPLQGLVSVHIYEEEISPYISDLSWDASTAMAIVDLVTYNNQTVESLGYGFPDDRVEGCDSDTEYDFSQTSSLGKIEAETAGDGYYLMTKIYGYSVFVATDANNIPDLCFLVYYRNGDGYPVQDFISVHAYEHNEIQDERESDLPPRIPEDSIIRIP